MTHILRRLWTDLHAGASFSNSAHSNQTITLANSGNTSVDFNVSAVPLGLVGGWIEVAPTTGVSYMESLPDLYAKVLSVMEEETY